jgi:hypothetical protein
LSLPAARSASAQEAPAPDAAAPSTGAEPAAPRPLSWHGSVLILYQRVGTQTLGVGPDYQSRNPYYDAVLDFRPRYYLWERAPSSLSIRAQIVGSYEITNSDTTTKRGELLLEDSVLSLVPEHTFGDGEDATVVSLSAPRLTLPTSYASRESGKIVDVGARVLIDHGVPLRTKSKLLPRGRLGARLGYAYGFVTGTVPTADTISRLRRNLDGHTVRNDQIGGAAFADHYAVLRGIVGADVYSDVLSFAMELGVDPAHKRELPVPLVRGLDTGPYLARSTEDPPRWVMSTYLDAAFTFHVGQVLDLAIGYENITGQLRPDGKRRNVFYSPDAKFYLAAELMLDKMFQAAAGSSASNVRKAVARSP